MALRTHLHPVDRCAACGGALLVVERAPADRSAWAEVTRSCLRRCDADARTDVRERASAR